MAGTIKAQVAPQATPLKTQKIVILLGLLGFIVMADNWVVSPILPAIAETLGIPVQNAGLLITAYMIPFGLFQLIFGPLADRFGKKQILTFSIVFFTILFILLFGMGHCLPLVIAGSSMAGVKKLLENYSWNTAGTWFRKMAGSFIFLLGIYFVLAPFTTDIAFGASTPKNILIISIDALHPKALGPKSSPLLDSIMKQGVYTLAGQSTAPPLTLISHAAMFSGLPPEQNGKMDNDWQPGQPTIENQTLFHAPKRAGFSTGYFYSKEKLGFLVNEDSLIPLIMISDIYDLTPYQNLPYPKSQYQKSQYQVTQLKGILDDLI